SSYHHLNLYSYPTRRSSDLSVFILMLTLSIRKPLEFSTFPTVLLISTALRLGLNIAATRLILAHGHDGTDSAGHIIEAFGGLIIDRKSTRLNSSHVKISYAV